MHAGWDSHYFSEGRDALDGDSLLAGSVELGWECLAGGVWYGNSPDQSYDEVQLSLALTHGVGDLEFYGGYTHLRFPFEDAHDNEIGGGAVWSNLPAELELGADASYSFDASGWFAEISASRAFPLTGRLRIVCAGVLGFNQGYVADGHDGANHVAAHLGLEYVVSESLTILAHTAYSWAIDRDRTLPGDEQLVDFLHGGGGLQWAF